MNPLSHSIFGMAFLFYGDNKRGRLNIMETSFFFLW